MKFSIETIYKPAYDNTDYKILEETLQKIGAKFKSYDIVDYKVIAIHNKKENDLTPVFYFSKDDRAKYLGYSLVDILGLHGDNKSERSEL